MGKKSSNLLKRIKHGIGQAKQETVTIHNDKVPDDRNFTRDHRVHDELLEFESKPLISKADMKFLAQSVDALNRVCFCEYEVKNIFKRAREEVDAIVELHRPHDHDGIFECVLQGEMEMLARTVHRNQNGEFVVVNCRNEDNEGFKSQSENTIAKCKNEDEDEGFMVHIGRWLEKMCTPSTNGKKLIHG